MSSLPPDRPAIEPGARSAYALVVSRYNSELTTALAGHARTELLTIEPSATVDTFTVPGSFEIPLMVQTLAAKHVYDAILALGVLLQGQTAHAQLIAASITNALQTIALAQRLPVLHEVLLVDDLDQARERCTGTRLNRGVEAARAAVEATRALRAAQPLTF